MIHMKHTLHLIAKNKGLWTIIAIIKTFQLTVELADWMLNETEAKQKTITDSPRSQARLT